MKKKNYDDDIPMASCVDVYLNIINMDIIIIKIKHRYKLDPMVFSLVLSLRIVCLLRTLVAVDLFDRSLSFSTIIIGRHLILLNITIILARIGCIILTFLVPVPQPSKKTSKQANKKRRQLRWDVENIFEFLKEIPESENKVQRKKWCGIVFIAEFNHLEYGEGEQTVRNKNSFSNLIKSKILFLDRIEPDYFNSPIETPIIETNCWNGIDFLD